MCSIICVPINKKKTPVRRIDLCVGSTVAAGVLYLVRFLNFIVKVSVVLGGSSKFNLLRAILV